MGLYFRFINIATAIFISISPAYAQELPEPLDFQGTYSLKFSAIPFGKLNINFKHYADSYEATSDLHTTGIARVFVKHDSRTFSKGTGENFSYPNVTYESNYATRGKKRYVKMVREEGKTVEEIVKPPDNRKFRPAVEEMLKQDAFDPLAFGLEMRTALAQCVEEECQSFKLRFYDGRRLNEGTFTRKGSKLVKVDGKKYTTHVVTVTRKALAGFTKGELEDIAKEGNYTLTLYFVYDQLIPVLAELAVGYGTAYAELQQK